MLVVGIRGMFPKMKRVYAACRARARVTPEFMKVIEA